MIDRTRVSRILKSYRDVPAADERARQRLHRHCWGHLGSGPIAGRGIGRNPVRAGRAAEEAPAPAPQVVEKNFALNSDVLFAFGKSTLKPEGVASLNTLYQQIVDVQPKDGSAVVVGYTDRIGSDAYNLKLSQKRAASVKSYLVTKGIPADKIYTEGKGKANPVTGNKCDKIGGAQNGSNKKLVDCLQPDRRAVLEIIGTK